MLVNKIRIRTIEGKGYGFKKGKGSLDGKVDKINISEESISITFTKDSKWEKKEFPKQNIIHYSYSGTTKTTIAPRSVSLG